LSQSIDSAIEKQGFSLVAFVFMPEHVHLLVFPRWPMAQIEALLYGIKRPFSFRIKKDLQSSRNPLLAELTIPERPGKRSFRFWQEGLGYDRNLISLEVVTAVAEYIHQNPVKRGLCSSSDQWKWSSWKHYHRPEQTPDPELPRVHGWPT